jgi:Tfp pilus assembly protein PilV
MAKKIIKTQSGYTIIETMIAISLFIVIVMSGMGALLNANLLHQKSRDMRSILDNLSFIMEDMSRNLRTGYNYRCVYNDDDLTSGNIGTPQSGSDCLGVAFEEASGNPTVSSDQWVYYLSGSAPDGFMMKSTAGALNPVQLNPDDIVIDQSSGFTVLGAEPVSEGDTQQPIITITLSGKILYKDIETPFLLRTSVSQRLIDVGN